MHSILFKEADLGSRFLGSCCRSERRGPFLLETLLPSAHAAAGCVLKSNVPVSWPCLCVGVGECASAPAYRRFRKHCRRGAHWDSRIHFDSITIRTLANAHEPQVAVVRNESSTHFTHYPHCERMRCVRCVAMRCVALAMMVVICDCGRGFDVVVVVVRSLDTNLMSYVRWLEHDTKRETTAVAVARNSIDCMFGWLRHSCRCMSHVSVGISRR